VKKLPFFKWYPADADTDANFRAMSDADIGFYIRCLNHAWINGGIPADPVERARVLHTRTDIANRHWERVGKCFVTSSSLPELLINSRQEMERGLASRKSQLATESVNVRYERKSNVAPRAIARASVSVSDSVSGFLNSSTGQRARETTSTTGRPASTPASVLPSVYQTEWPLTTAAIRDHDLAVDDIFVRRLADATAQRLISAGDMETFDDEDLAFAVRKSYAEYTGRGNHGIGLLLMRVPQILLALGENGNGEQNKAI